MLKMTAVVVSLIIVVASSAFAGIYGEVDHVVKDGVAHNDYIGILSTTIGSVSPTWIGVRSADGWFETCLGVGFTPIHGINVLVFGGADSDDPHWHYGIIQSVAVSDLAVSNAFENGGGGIANRFVANGPSGVTGLRVGIMAQVGQGSGPRLDYHHGLEGKPGWGAWAAYVQSGEHSVWHAAVNLNR